MSDDQEPQDTQEITIDSGSSTIGIELVAIIIPLVVTPIIGFVVWYLRGAIEHQRQKLDQHKDEKRATLIENITRQIKEFYWPLYINLKTYESTLNRYKEFREGKFSLVSNESNYDSPRDAHIHTHTDHISIQMVEISSSTEDPQLIPSSAPTPASAPQPSRDQPPTLDESTKTINSNIDTISLNLFTQYQHIIEDYEKHLIEILVKIQTICHDSTPLGEPDDQLFDLIIDLDTYVTYIITFRTLNQETRNDKLMSKIDRAVFPTQIIPKVYSRLKELRKYHSDLIFNQDSELLEATELPQPQPTLPRKSIFSHFMKQKISG